MDEVTQRVIRKEIQERLHSALPVPVMVSFLHVKDVVDNEGYYEIGVFWPKYVLSWVGRPEPHVYEAQVLVERSFNRNWFTRIIGRLVAPYVQSYVASKPVILMPKTEVEYPEGRARLRVNPDVVEDPDYLHGLIIDWAETLKLSVLRQRGAQE